MKTQNKAVVLIVEDELTRRDEFKHKLGSEVIMVTAANPLGAIKEIRTRQFDLIFLDGDLGDKNLDGSDVACCFYGSPNAKASVIVHSMNPPLATRMNDIVNIVGGKSVLLPYSLDNFWAKSLEIIQGLGS